MNHLKDKSDENILAADKLIRQNHYASSIHCSYYACVQLMLHIFRSDLSKTDDEVEELMIEAQKNGDNTHVWLLKEIGNTLFFKHPLDSREFRNKLGMLKGVRVKADYKNKQISKSIASDSYDTANAILLILKTHFTI